MTSRLVRGSVGMLLGGTHFALAQIELAQGNDEWTHPFPPFKLIGNIYWVGSYHLSTDLQRGFSTRRSHGGFALNP